MPSLPASKPEFHTLSDNDVVEALTGFDPARLRLADNPVAREVCRLVDAYTQRLSAGRGVWHPFPQNAVERAALGLFAEELKRRLAIKAGL